MIMYGKCNINRILATFNLHGIIIYKGQKCTVYSTNSFISFLLSIWFKKDRTPLLVFVVNCTLSKIELGTRRFKYSFYLHAIPIKNEKLSLREMCFSLYLHNKNLCIGLIEKTKILSR